MNILFLTLVRITDINERGIYTDLVRKFRDEGHQITVVCPVERRYNTKTGISTQEGVKLLSVRTLNLQKTNVVEKGLGLILLEYQFQRAIDKHLSGEAFELVLYSTPPITLTSIIRNLKIKYSSRTYLLLKDIFPQNAVDIGMMIGNSIVYKYFRKKEKQLYTLSDKIGCMSPANVSYLLKHNPEIASSKVEVCPNSIELLDSKLSAAQKESILLEHRIPVGATVCIYGGNLGKPQGIDFLLDVIKSNIGNKDIFFMIVGSGTEYNKVKLWFEEYQPINAKLLPGLPKIEYDKLIKACHVGLIFLDKRFTIPNFPSRLLSYLENKMPILAATDTNTDIGKIAQENKFGFWCESGDLSAFNTHLKTLTNKKLQQEMGENGYLFLMSNYTVDRSYQIIMNNKEQQKQHIIDMMNDDEEIGLYDS